MLKKHIATLRVEVEAQSTEVLHDVLHRLCDRINKKPPSVLYDDVGLGAVKSTVRVTRVRPARARSKKK